MAHKFSRLLVTIGQILVAPVPTLLVKLNGKKFAKRSFPVSFEWQKKFGEIDLTVGPLSINHFC